MGDWGMGYGFFVPFVVLLFWVLFLGTVVFGIRWLLRGENSADSLRRDTPMETLRKRYARGEIDKAEFETRKRELA